MIPHRISLTQLKLTEGTIKKNNFQWLEIKDFGGFLFWFPVFLACKIYRKTELFVCYHWQFFLENFSFCDIRKTSRENTMIKNFRKNILTNLCPWRCRWTWRITSLRNQATKCVFLVLLKYIVYVHVKKYFLDSLYSYYDYYRC